MILIRGKELEMDHYRNNKKFKLKREQRNVKSRMQRMNLRTVGGRGEIYRQIHFQSLREEPMLGIDPSLS